MRPPDPTRQLQAAVNHHQAGRFEPACRIYAQVRRTSPQAFDAWHLGGLAAHQLGRHDEAALLLTRALALAPRSALCAFRLGAAQLALGALEASAANLHLALELDPTLSEAWEHLAFVRHRQGALAGALDAAREAMRLRPAEAGPHERVGALLAESQGFAAALPCLRETTRRWPAHAAGWKNLGIALATLHQPEEALRALDRALALDPGQSGARLGRALALQEACRLPEAVAEYEGVLAGNPLCAEAASARLLCLNYLEEVSATALKAAHDAFGRTHHQNLPPRVFPVHPRPGPLRVAFLSPDLRYHSVASFLEPLLTHLDRARFEVWLYHDHPLLDAVSGRLRALAAHWRHFAGQPSAVVEAAIRSDGPDVLVDLAGHTGINRLPLYAHRLAPVQITYLGYPNTTGLAAMDFRFTDAQADPAGLADSLCTEKLVRFAPTAWAWRPPEAAPPVAPPPCLARPGAEVTFGSFNNPAKLSDGTLRRWAAALAAVPHARLLLKGHGLDSAARQQEFRARCAGLGLDPARVGLAGRTPGTAGHLELYRLMDVALDPFPYHGTTTTCEALWMGRPVVTLAGREHRNRVGVSLLKAAGHPEWIAESDADYTRIAAGLAGDPARLAALGAGLRADLQAGPLLDHAAQARRFGEALLACWASTVQS
jgi:predicted O-linked N-acetylglucosamine transferase (SPINDLY family)